MEEQVVMDKQVAVDAQAAVAIVDQKAVVRGALPRSVVEAIAVPYRPINVPFRHSVYQMLSVEQRDIRLLEIKFSADSDPIRCNLMSFSLKNEKPEYAVLSDDGDNVITSSLEGHLELNGHQFSAKERVISAIRQFRAAAKGSGYGWSGKAVRLWANTLCINQANLSERNSQVQLMREIYANAKVVWACSNKSKDAALVTGVDPEEVMKVGSKAGIHKGTALAGRLPAQSKSKTTPARVYPREILRMPDLTGAFLNVPSIGREKASTPPQPASMDHYSQPCKTRHDLIQNKWLDDVFSTKTLKSSLEDIERSADARLRDGIAPPTADPITSIGGKSIFEPPHPSSVQKRSNFLHGIGAVQRAQQVRPFEYQPLKRGREIRLFQIDKQPAGFLNIFKCKLVHAQLDDPSYSYNAISYTWGDPSPTRLLIVDCDQCLRVTENVGLLVDFLFKGMDFGTSFFWIDAVCINQADPEEKSSQVSLMRYIYQHAYVVIIWLGEPVGSYEEEAIEDLQRLERFFKLYEAGNDKYGIILSKRAKQDAHSDTGERGTVWLKEVSPDGRVRIRRPSLADMSRRHTTPAMIEARFRLHYGKELPTDWNWGHISMLLSKPWFERVWVIQEAFAGSKALLHCGNKVMPWEDFNFVTSRLMQCGLDASIHHGTGESAETAIKTVPVGLTSAVFIHALRITKANKKPLRLAPLLLITSRYQATNPRDKVYALLGISSEGNHSNLVPNYSLTVEEVFIKTAVHLIQKDKSLEILAAAGIGCHRETPNLPSWVPDFKCPPELPKWRFKLCRDSSTTPTDESQTISTVKFIPESNSLVVSGLLIDEVIWVGPLLCPQPPTAKVGGDAAYMDGFNGENKSWFFQTKFMCQSLNQYPTNEPLEEVYWRTLIMNSTHQGFPAIAEYGTSFRRSEFGIGDVVNYHEAHKKERVDLAILMDELTHHEKQDSVTAELAYMQRTHQASTLELNSRWNQAYATNGAGRNAFITRHGYFGIAAPGIEEGDQVAFFSGVVTPMILRGVESSERETASKLKPAYNLVSESYIHGLMSGGSLRVGEMHDICLC